MESNQKYKGNSYSYSMRKIPTKLNNSISQSFDDKNIDKIKILELSNIIDVWEQEILFSENGFFSIKGKDVQNKLNEFILDLEKLINSKIYEMKFTDANSKQIVNKIKQDKIDAIKREMQVYEQQELQNWEMEVYETAINFSIKRAILYKSNDKVVSSSLNNGLAVLNVMAEKEQWSEKIKKFKKEKYISEFYSSLIDELLLEKNPQASVYFDKYKDILEIGEKEKIQSYIKELKDNVVAYNWSKELFSYNLPASEQEIEIKNIKDVDIEKNVRRYLSEFSLSKKKNKEEEEKQANIKNWQEVIDFASSDLDKAYLYIDFSSSSESIKHKKDYLKQIKKQGYILTDKKQFISLYKECLEDFCKFQNKDISNFHSCLSLEDFEIFSSFQKMKSSEFDKIKSDSEYVIKEMDKNKIVKEESRYNFIQMMLGAMAEYKSVNKKEANLEERNKIIKLIVERFKDENK